MDIWPQGLSQLGYTTANATGSVRSSQLNTGANFFDNILSLIILFDIISSDWWQRNPVRNNIKANYANFSCILCVMNQQSTRTAAILGLCPVEDAFLPHTVNNTVVKFGSNLA